MTVPNSVVLSALMARAARERWCRRWRCTTCGSPEMRSSFSSLLGEWGAPGLLSALAGVGPELEPEAAEWLLCALTRHVPPSMIQEVLLDCPAGFLFERMLRAKAKADERRREHALRNDPEQIVLRREAKKKARAAAHLQRLEAKKLRDAEYFARTLIPKV